MYLQLNTKFNPFTYKEMVEPLAYYKQAYDEVQQAYDAITDDAETLQTIVDEENSPIAYGTYNRYMYELNNALDSFGEGLTPGTRRRLSRLRGRFNSDIKPIANAYQRKLALQDEQRKAEVSNPTMLWQRKASEMSLDDIIANPTIDYGGSYSGAAITQQVANMAAKLSKEAQEGEQGKTILKQLLPFQYEALSRTGFSSDAVMAAIINSPDAPEILTNMIENTINSTGIREWNNSEALQRAYDYARQGLYNAIGETSRNIVTDQAGLAAYKAQLDYKMAEKAAQKKAEEEAQQRLARLTPDRFLWTNSDVTKYKDALMSLTDKNGRFFRQFFGRGTTKDPFINPIEFRDALVKYVEDNSDDPRLARTETVSVPNAPHYVPPVQIENMQTMQSFIRGNIKYEDLNKDLKDFYDDYLIKNNIPSYVRPVGDGQYNALRAIGYDKKGGAPIERGDDLNYEKGLKPYIDKLGEARTSWSTSMSDYSYPDDVIKRHLDFWNQNNTFQQKVYEVKKNGEIGKHVKYDDLDLKNNNITDISYYPYQPDYIMITVGKSTYYIQPEALGATVGDFIRYNADIIKSTPNMTSEEMKAVGQNVTSALVQFLNNYNQTLSKTSSTTVQ